MMLSALMVFLAFLMSLFLLLTLVLSTKTIFLREKMSSFECGFDTKNMFRNSFSIRFFFIMLMFLIFDTEIVIILPMPISTWYANNLEWSLIINFFLFILLTGLLMEWKFGVIKWA